MAFCHICLDDEDQFSLNRCKVCGEYVCPDHTTVAYGKLQCEDCLEKNEKYDVADVEKAIGIKASKWKGRCHEIAAKMQAALKIDATLRYGAYHGPVAERGYFKGRSVSRHGWLELKNGEVIDPTRWVFEDVTPYIYFGPNDDEYDFGAEKLRQSIRSGPPEYVAENAVSLASIPVATRKFLLSKVQGKGNKVGVHQLIWLGGMGITELGKHAKPFYTFLVKNNKGGFIPIDFRRAVLG